MTQAQLDIAVNTVLQLFDAGLLDERTVQRVGRAVEEYLARIETEEEDDAE